MELHIEYRRKYLGDEDSPDLFDERREPMDLAELKTAQAILRRMSKIHQNIQNTVDGRALESNVYNFTDSNKYKIHIRDWKMGLRYHATKIFYQRDDHCSLYTTFAFQGRCEKKNYIHFRSNAYGNRVSCSSNKYFIYRPIIPMELINMDLDSPEFLEDVKYRGDSALCLQGVVQLFKVSYGFDEHICDEVFNKLNGFLIMSI